MIRRQGKCREVDVPDVIGMELAEAARFEKAGLDYLAEETGTVVVDQMPNSGASVITNTTVLLYTDKDPDGNIPKHPGRNLMNHRLQG